MLGFRDSDPRSHFHKSVSEMMKDGESIKLNLSNEHWITPTIVSHMTSLICVFVMKSKQDLGLILGLILGLKLSKLSIFIFKI